MLNTSLIAGKSQPMLTGQHLVMLSNKITDKQTLRMLAVVGLRMQTETVDSHLYGNTINDAAYEVLSEWKKGQSNDEKAYSNICQALTNVKLESFIDEILQ